MAAPHSGDITNDWLRAKEADQMQELQLLSHMLHLR